MYTLVGNIKVINDTQVISEKFRKREFVVTDNSGQYPQDVLFQLTQDKTDLLNDMQLNEMVSVSFFIRGREWTSPSGEVRYFNSLDVWKIEKQSGGMPTPQDMSPASSDSAETFVEEGDDDLPF
ncbi:hypothetical protein GCM10009118_30640 [Wandonia haliotis]|uniref:DUF3127 domain-containing protein n=1 Tax=Wandonia haliotis TaxID=574963 RepID=A0ABN1MUP5_9FLAO